MEISQDNVSFKKEKNNNVPTESTNCVVPEQLEPSPFGGIAGVSVPQQLGTPSNSARKNSGRAGRKDRRNLKSLKKKYILRSSAKSNRVLRSRSREKPEAPVSSNNLADVSASGEKKRKKRKRIGKKEVTDEFSRIRKHLRYLLQRMSYEHNLIEAYSAEGWKGLSVDKLKPEKELERARSEIMRCKSKIRDLFQRLDLLIAEGKLPESLFDSEGQIGSEDIFCAKCGSKDLTLDNDIILCDGACDRGFHQYCLMPPLVKEDIPPDDEGWLCPACDCKVDCIDLINDSQGTDLSVEDSWEEVFPEAAGGHQDPNLDLPSDDSDDDYNPDGSDTEEEITEKHSSSDESEYASASEQLEAPPKDEQYLGLSSEDSGDEDYNPEAPDLDENVKQESSSSDFTSASEDLGAELDAAKSSAKDEGGFSSPPDDVSSPRVSGGCRSNFGAKKRSLKNEVASLSQDSGKDGSTPVSGKRHVERLDYKKLYDEAYGNVPSESSDDENWTDTSATPGEENGDVALLSPNGNGPMVNDKNNSKNNKSGQKRTKQSPKRSHQKMNIDDTDNSPVSSLPGLVDKKGKLLVQKRLGEAATQRLYQSFKQNQYPSRATKESLAKEFGLTVQQVNKWFQNARWSSRHSPGTEASAGKSSSLKQRSSAQPRKNMPEPRQETGGSTCNGVEYIGSPKGGSVLTRNHGEGKELVLEENSTISNSRQRKGKGKSHHQSSGPNLGNGETPKAPEASKCKRIQKRRRKSSA